MGWIRSRLAVSVLLPLLGMQSISSLAVAQEPFARGDANSDTNVDISDAIFSLGCQFLGTRCPDCMDAADSNDDGKYDIADVIYTLNWAFRGGPIPPAPGPDGCGTDPTTDNLSCATAICTPAGEGVCCAFVHQHHCELTTAAECELVGGTFAGVGTTCDDDCDGDGSPDACELDCNGNSVPDKCELRDGLRPDCNGNGVPDECDSDCDRSGVPDDCELASGQAPDCDLNGFPDSCDIESARSRDCNGNGVPDGCDLADISGCPPGVVGCHDCNENGIPDECDIASCPAGDRSCADCDGDRVPDGCSRCLIPGDMNDDGSFDVQDQALLEACLASSCPEGRCECADVDEDGDVDATDSALLAGIILGQPPPRTMAISDFRPRRAGPGEIVTIEGRGFGNNPDNLCVVAMNPDSMTAIPFQALEATDRRVIARVGTIAIDDKPAPIMIVRGQGAFVPIEVSGEAHAPRGGWVWQPTPAAVGQAPIAVAPHIFIPGPPPCGIVTGQLVNNKLCLTIDKGCRAGSSLEIFCRAWDHTPNPDFGVDGYIPALVFNTDHTPMQCAQAICTAIVNLYASQNPPVTINCMVTTVGNAVKMTLMYPNNPITWGVFSIKGPEIQIEINNTPATDDDYVTWGPTFCRARILGLTGNAADCNVVLTNDDPNAIPTGGDVLFAPFQVNWPVATTATQNTLNLTLPANGNWADFVIAGKFGKPSTNDKDAVIEVHEGAATGPLCCRHELMVRVRKNGNTLTTGERDRYVNAILALHAANKYVVYQNIHNLASSQAHGYSPGPNQFTSNPAFLPWHRAFVLEYERSLQTIDPSVAAHYWDYRNPAPNIFNSGFMGTNDGAGNVNTGPFATWTIQALTPIKRATHNHQSFANVATDVSVVAAATFSSFKNMEGTSHNGSHGWVGGWMGIVQQAVRDPVFFMLHSNVERLYSKWQSMGHHGNGANEYTPQGSYACSAAAQCLLPPYVQGSFLNDTLWPWNGLAGAGTCGISVCDDRPASAPGGALDPPAAPGFVLGPPATPTVDNVIDYLGRQDPTKALGYSYDDTPYN